MYINFLTEIPLYEGVMTSYNILGDIYLFETIPEIIVKKWPRLRGNLHTTHARWLFDFYKKIHRTQTFFQILHPAERLGPVLPTSRSIKQPFLNIYLLAYLSISVVSTGHEIKIRRSMLFPWLASINNINFRTTIFLYLF